MLRSMTAYGRASIKTPIGSFVAEIQSVNRKFLEISVYLPKEIGRFELEVRKWVEAAIHRGQVTVKVSAQFDAVAPVSISPNLPIARQMIAAWKLIENEAGGKPSTSFDLSLLANKEGILIYAENLQDEEMYRDALSQVVALALEKFIQMREVEGSALSRDISERLEKMRGYMELIEAKSPEVSKRYRQKLMERLEEVLPGRFENEERIVREVALLAEKVDITEEIIRFRSHLSQFDQLLKTASSSVGKTLEFLVQELNREINTTGSKSMEVAISYSVIDVKSELERIREQIQNIE